jgi:archaemetzincin
MSSLMRCLVFLLVLLSRSVCCLAIDFIPPNEGQRLAALGKTEDLSNVLKRALDVKGFEPINPPKGNDWLAAHEEPGQTFDQYVKARPNRPDTTRNKVYLLPIGKFPEDRSPSLEYLKQYASAFFQMKVEVLPPLIKYSFTNRINSNTRQRQIQTSDVLLFLESKLPEDGFCILGITMEDLYPNEKWNFVFGQAALVRRVGVYSFARYDPAFLGQPRDPDYMKTILKRSCRVLAHETGHMFRMQHCIFFNCVMNGCNHLGESDSRPMHLCPVCLRKLQFNTGFDVVKHYKEQQKFFNDAGLKDDAQWIEMRLQRITK